MRGRGRGWTTVAGAAAVVVLGAGCGTGTGGGGGASAFGRETAHAEIVAAVEKAGLPKSDLPGIGGATPTGSTSPRPTPSTERDRLAERAAACTAAWQYIGPPVDGSRAGLEKAVATLVGEDWVQGERQVEKLDDKGGTMLQFTLRKRGWVMYARHAGVTQSLSMEMVSLNATETACMNRFTEQEKKVLFGEDAERS